MDIDAAVSALAGVASDRVRDAAGARKVLRSLLKSARRHGADLSTDDALRLHRALLPMLGARESGPRASALRVLRYVLASPGLVIEFGRDRGILALVRSLEREPSLVWERTQAVKLGKHLLTVAPGHVPRALIRSFVALAQATGDTFHRVALDLLLWCLTAGYPSLLSLVASTGGVQALLEAALAPGPGQDVGERILLTLAHTMNHAANHSAVPPSAVAHRVVSVFTSQLTGSVQVGWSKLHRLAEAKAAGGDGAPQLPFWTTRGLPSGAVMAGKVKATRSKAGAPPPKHEPPTVGACRSMAVARAAVVTLARTWAGLFALTSSPHALPALVAMLNQPLHPRVLLSVLRTLGEVLAPPRRDAWSATSHAAAVVHRQRILTRRALRWHMYHQAPLGGGAPWVTAGLAAPPTSPPDIRQMDREGSATSVLSSASAASSADSSSGHRDGRTASDASDVSAVAEAADAAVGAAEVAEGYAPPVQGVKEDCMPHRAFAAPRLGVPGMLGHAVDADVDGPHHKAQASVGGGEEEEEGAEGGGGSDSDATVLDYFMGLGAEMEADVGRTAPMLRVGSARATSRSARSQGGRSSGTGTSHPAGQGEVYEDAVPELDAECRPGFWVQYVSSSGAAAICRRDMPTIMLGLESGAALQPEWWAADDAQASSEEQGLGMPAALAAAALGSPRAPHPPSSSGKYSTSHALDSYTATVLVALLRAGLLQPLALLTTHHDAMLGLASSALLTTILALTVQLLPREYSLHVLAMPELVQLAAAANAHTPLPSPSTAATQGHAAFQAHVRQAAATRAQFTALLTFVQSCNTTASAARISLAAWQAGDASAQWDGAAGPLSWPKPGHVPLDWRLTPMSASWAHVSGLLHVAVGGGGVQVAGGVGRAPLDHLLAADALEAGAGQVPGFGFPGRAHMRGYLAGGAGSAVAGLGTAAGTPYIDPDVNVLDFDAGLALPEDGSRQQRRRFRHHGLYGAGARSIMAEGGDVLGCGQEEGDGELQGVLSMGPGLATEGSMMYTEVSDDEEGGGVGTLDMWVGRPLSPDSVFGGLDVEPDEAEGGAGEWDAALPSGAAGLAARRATMVRSHRASSASQLGDLPVELPAAPVRPSAAPAEQPPPGVGSAAAPDTPTPSHDPEAVLRSALAHAAVTVPRMAAVFGLPQYPGAAPHPHALAASGMGIDPRTFPGRDGSGALPSFMAALPPSLGEAHKAAWSPLNRLLPGALAAVDRHVLSGGSSDGSRAHQASAGIIPPSQGGIRGVRAATVLRSLVGHAAAVLARWAGSSARVGSVGVGTAASGGQGGLPGGPLALLQAVNDSHEGGSSGQAKAGAKRSPAESAGAARTVLLQQGEAPALTHSAYGAVVSSRLGLASAAALYGGGDVARYVASPSDVEVYEVLATAAQSEVRGARGTAEARMAAAFGYEEAGHEEGSEDEDANEWSMWGPIEDEGEEEAREDDEGSLTEGGSIGSPVGPRPGLPPMSLGPALEEGGEAPGTPPRATPAFPDSAPDSAQADAAAATISPYALPAAAIDQGVITFLTEPVQLRVALPDPRHGDAPAAPPSSSAAMSSPQPDTTPPRREPLAFSDSDSGEEVPESVNLGASGVPPGSGDDSASCDMAEERIITTTRLDRMRKGRGVFVNMQSSCGPVGLHFPVAITASATHLLAPEQLYPVDYDVAMNGQGRLEADPHTWTTAVSAAVSALADLHDPSTRFHTVSLASLSMALARAVVPLNEAGEPAVLPGVQSWRCLPPSSVQAAAGRLHPVAQPLLSLPHGGAWSGTAPGGIAGVDLTGYRQRISTRRLLQELTLASRVAASAASAAAEDGQGKGRAAHTAGEVEVEEADFPRRLRSAYEVAPAKWTPPPKGQPGQPAPTRPSNFQHKYRIVRRSSGRPHPRAEECGSTAAALATENAAFYGPTTRAALAAFESQRGDAVKDEVDLRRAVRRHRRVGSENGLAFVGETDPGGAAYTLNVAQVDANCSPSELLVFDGGMVGVFTGALQSTLALGGAEAGSMLAPIATAGNASFVPRRFRNLVLAVQRCAVVEGQGAADPWAGEVHMGHAGGGVPPSAPFSPPTVPEDAPLHEGLPPPRESAGSVVLPLSPQESLSTVMGEEDVPGGGGFLRGRMDTLTSVGGASAPASPPSKARVTVLPAAAERLEALGMASQANALGFRFTVPRSMLAMTPVLLAAFPASTPAPMRDVDLPSPATDRRGSSAGRGGQETPPLFSAARYQAAPPAHPTLVAMAAARDVVASVTGVGSRRRSGDVTLIPFPSPVPDHAMAALAVGGDGWAGAGRTPTAIMARIAAASRSRSVAACLGLAGPNAHVRERGDPPSAAALAAGGGWVYWGPGHGYVLGEAHTRSRRMPLQVVPRGSGIALEEGQGVEEDAAARVSDRSGRPVLTKWMARGHWRRERAVAALLARAVAAVAATGVMDTVDGRLWDWAAIGHVLDTVATSPEVLSVLLGAPLHSRQGGAAEGAGPGSWEAFSVDDKTRSALGDGKFMHRLCGFFTLHMDWLGGMLARQEEEERARAAHSSSRASRVRAQTAAALASAPKEHAAGSSGPSSTVVSPLADPSASEAWGETGHGTGGGSAAGKGKASSAAGGSGGGFFGSVASRVFGSSSEGNPFEAAGSLALRGFPDMPWSPAALRMLRVARQWLLLLLMHPKGRELLLEPADPTAKPKDFAKERAKHGYAPGDARRFIAQILLALRYEVGNTANVSLFKPLVMLDDSHSDPSIMAPPKATVSRGAKGMREWEEEACAKCPSPFAWSRFSLVAGRELLALVGVLTSCKQGIAILHELDKAGFDVEAQEVGGAGEGGGPVPPPAHPSHGEGVEEEAEEGARPTSTSRPRPSMHSTELATYESKAMTSFRRKTMRSSHAAMDLTGTSAAAGGASAPVSSADSTPAPSPASTPHRPSADARRMSSVSVASRGKGRVRSLSTLMAPGAVVLGPGSRSTSTLSIASEGREARSTTGFFSHLYRTGGGSGAPTPGRDNLVAPRDADAIGRILLPAARHRSKDYLSRAVLSYVDYDRAGAAGRLLISTWAASRAASPSLRLYAVAYTRVLLRQGCPGWSSWAVDTLVTAMHLRLDAPHLAAAALSVLTEAAATAEVYRRAIVARRPPVQDFPPSEVYPLLLHLVSEPEGMLLAAQCGMLGSLMQAWLGTEHVRWAAEAEAALASGLTSDAAWWAQAAEPARLPHAADPTAAGSAHAALAAQAAHAMAAHATALPHAKQGGQVQSTGVPGQTPLPPAPPTAEPETAEHVAVHGVYPRSSEGVPYTPPPPPSTAWLGRGGSARGSTPPPPDVPSATHRPLLTPVILPQCANSNGAGAAARGGDGVDLWTLHALPWRVEVWAEWSRGVPGAPPTSTTGAGKASDLVRIRLACDTFVDSSGYSPEAGTVPGGAPSSGPVVRAVVCNAQGSPHPAEVPPHAKLYAALFVGPTAMNHVVGDIPFAPGTPRSSSHTHNSDIAAVQMGRAWFAPPGTKQVDDARLHAWRRRVGAARPSPFGGQGDKAADLSSSHIRGLDRMQGVQRVGKLRQEGAGEADEAPRSAAEAAALVARAQAGWRLDTAADLGSVFASLDAEGPGTAGVPRALVLPKGVASVLGVGAAMGPAGLPLFEPLKPLTVSTATARLKKRLEGFKKDVENAVAAQIGGINLRSAHSWAVATGLLGVADVAPPSASGAMLALSTGGVPAVAAANLVATQAFRAALLRHLVADGDSAAAVAALAGVRGTPHDLRNSAAASQLDAALRVAGGTFTVPERITNRKEAEDATRIAASVGSFAAAWMVCVAQGAVDVPAAPAHRPSAAARQPPPNTPSPGPTDTPDGPHTECPAPEEAQPNLLQVPGSAAQELQAAGEAVWGVGCGGDPPQTRRGSTVPEPGHPCLPTPCFTRTPLGAHCAYHFTTSRLSPGSIRLHSVEFPLAVLGNSGVSPHPSGGPPVATTSRAAPAAVDGMGYAPLPLHLYGELTKHSVGRRTLLASGHLSVFMGRVCDAGCPPLLRRSALLSLASVASSPKGYALLCDRVAPDFPLRLDALARGAGGDLAEKAARLRACATPDRAARAAAAGGLRPPPPPPTEQFAPGTGEHVSLRGAALQAMSMVAGHVRGRTDLRALGWARVVGSDLPYAPVVPLPGSCTLDDFFRLPAIPRQARDTPAGAFATTPWAPPLAGGAGGAPSTTPVPALSPGELRVGDGPVQHDPHAGFTSAIRADVPTQECEEVLEQVAALSNRIAMKDCKPALVAARRGRAPLFALPSMLWRAHHLLAGMTHSLGARRFVHTLFDRVSMSERYWRNTLQAEAAKLQQQ